MEDIDNKNVEPLISDGILNKDMLNLLHLSIEAGVSILFASANLSDAYTFVSSLIQSTAENIDHPYLLVANMENNDETRQFSESLWWPARLGIIDLDGLNIEKATQFHKIGGLLMHPISSENSHLWLKVALRAQALAIIEANNCQDAVTQIKSGIAQYLPQIDTVEIERWVREQMPLIVDIFRDELGNMRINLLDLGKYDHEAATMPYIYKYSLDDNGHGQFFPKDTAYSFYAQLQQVSLIIRVNNEKIKTNSIK